MLLASAVLWLLHDQLHWAANYIIGALGVATLLATIYVTSILPANSLRLFLLGLTRVLFPNPRRGR